eukprot:s352_g32.t1
MAQSIGYSTCFLRKSSFWIPQARVRASDGKAVAGAPAQLQLSTVAGGHVAGAPISPKLQQPQLQQPQLQQPQLQQPQLQQPQLQQPQLQQPQLQQPQLQQPSVPCIRPPQIHPCQVQVTMPGATTAAYPCQSPPFPMQRWKGVDSPFMGAAHSCRDACDAKDASPQIVVAEQVIADLEPQHGKAIEQPVKPEQVVQVTQEGCADGTDSKIRRSLLLEKKLYTDTEIMRGVPLKHTLRNFGRIWRQSPLDMTEDERLHLWDAAFAVKEFDVFLSHTWHTKGIWKFLSLSLQLTWIHVLLWGLGAAIFFEFLFFVDALPPLGDPWEVNFQGYQGTAPFSLWAVVGECTSVLPFLLAPWMPFANQRFAFVDVASIHQVDESMKERGIYGLGGFLKASKELRILWSPPYLSRLWCIFELAAYRISNPAGKIVLQPLFVEASVLAGWLGMHTAMILWLVTTVYLTSWGATFFLALVPFAAVFHSLRKNFLVKRQLFDDIQHFDLAAVECRAKFDKEFVHAAIVEWYGGADAFTEYVRGPLQEELVSRQRTGVQISYCMMLVAPFLSVGISTFMGLLKANVPIHISASYFLGGMVGLWICWMAAMVQFALFLCDHLARPLMPRLDILQTIFIFAVMGAMAYLGLQFGVTAYRNSLLAASIWSAVSLLVLWLTNGGLGTCFQKVKSFRK